MTGTTKTLPASYADIGGSDPRDVRRAAYFLTQSADRFEAEGQPGTANVLRVLALALNEQEMIRKATEETTAQAVN